MSRVLSLLLPVMLAWPAGVLADSGQWQDRTHHIRFGFQGTQVKSGGFATWFDGKYSNPTAKDLGGFHIGVGVGLGADYFAAYDLQWVTRGSTTLDNQTLMAGKYFRLGEPLRAQLSAGAFRADADRATGDANVRRNLEHAAAVEAGLEWRPNSLLSLAPAWRVAFLPDGGLHEYRLDTRLNASSGFSLELSLLYLKWHELDQVSWQVGPRFTF